MRKVKIFAGTATLTLADRVAHAFDQEALNRSKLAKFSDGELMTTIEDGVRGSNSYVIQSLIPPSDNIMELLLMGDALKRASADGIIAVIPYMGYARQDRKDRPRVPIGAKLVADIIHTAGFTRVVTIDLHADQIQGFFNMPVDHLSANFIFVPHLRQLNLPHLTFCSPDAGGIKRVKKYADIFDCEMVFCYKHRPKPNEVGELKLIGDVKGKNVVLVDDMIDTAGTICSAANMMMEQGALSVRAMVTHPVLSGGAYNNIEKSALLEVITTDTIPLKDPKHFADYEKSTRKFTVLSVDQMLADAIHKINNFESISSTFGIK